MVRFWNTGKYVFRLILSFVLLLECGKKEIVFVTVVMLYLIVEPSHTYDVRTRPHHVCDTFLSCTCTLSKNLFYGSIINDSSSALACGVTCYTHTYAPCIYRGCSQIPLSFVNHSITFLTFSCCSMTYCRVFVIPSLLFYRGKQSWIQYGKPRLLSPRKPLTPKRRTERYS